MRGLCASLPQLSPQLPCRGPPGLAFRPVRQNDDAVLKLGSELHQALQQRSEQIERTDGDPIVGRVVGEEGGDLLVMANPFLPDEKIRVKASAVVSRKPFATSMMPPGLINSLNPEELQDLLAYVLSAGNEKDAMFKK